MCLIKTHILMCWHTRCNCPLIILFFGYFHTQKKVWSWLSYKSLPHKLLEIGFFSCGVGSWVYPTISSHVEISQHLPNIYPKFLPQNLLNKDWQHYPIFTHTFIKHLSNMIDSIPNFYPHIYPTLNQHFYEILTNI